MTVPLAALDSVLEPFRPGVDADGFDVSVQDFAGGKIVVRVLHKPDACEECLIPDDTLGPMLAAAFRDVAPEVSEVRIEHVRAA